MGNSEGYREDLGASQERCTQLEKELDALRKLKEPDIAARKKRFQIFYGLWAVLLCISAVALWASWDSLNETRERSDKEVVRMGVRIDVLRAEYGTLQGIHQRLTRRVEEQREVLAELRNTPRRQTADDPPPVADQSSNHQRPLSDDIASRLALCRATRVGQFSYQEGVIVSLTRHYTPQSQSSMAPHLCSVDWQVLVRFPSGEQRSLSYSTEVYETSASACMSTAALESITSMGVLWGDVRRGTIVGLSIDGRNAVAGVRITSK